MLTRFDRLRRKCRPAGVFSITSAGDKRTALPYRADARPPGVDKNLLSIRGGEEGDFTEHAFIGWRIAPADNRQGFCCNSSSTIWRDAAASSGSLFKRSSRRRSFWLSASALFGHDAKETVRFCNSKPQPSPVLPSARIAPRCCIRASACMAVRTTLWLGSPSMWSVEAETTVILLKVYRTQHISELPGSSTGHSLNRRRAGTARAWRRGWRIIRLPRIRPLCVLCALSRKYTI